MSALNTSSTTDELNRFYEEYVSSYNDGDLNKYCDFFGAPLTTVWGSVSQVYFSPADVRASAEAQQRSFASSGWSHTVVAAKRVWIVDAELAVIVADLDRIDVSGDVYQTGRCIYNVVRRDGVWKIVTVAQSIGAFPSSAGLLEPGATD